MLPAQVMGAMPVPPSLPCRPLQVAGMGFLMLYPRMDMLPRGPPLSPPRRLYSSEASGSKNKVNKFEQLDAVRKQLKVQAILVVKDKFQQLRAMRAQFKLYLSAILKASFSYMKKIAVEILRIMKEVAVSSGHQVVAGYKSYVSQSYFLCFLIVVLGLGVWFSDALHWFEPTSTEGDESYLDRWEARLEELLTEFPQKIALGALHLNLAFSILNEMISARKEFTIALNKKIKVLKQMIEELQKENSALKAEVAEKAKMLKELGEEVAEMKEAIKSAKRE